MLKVMEENQLEKKTEVKLCATFSTRRWFHFEEVLRMKSTFGEKVEFSDILCMILESNFESVFEKAIEKLAQRRAEADAKGDRVGSLTAKGTYKCLYM